MLDIYRQTRLDEVARIGVRLEAETGVPAALLVAQWAVESQWGERPVGNANYFGMKRAARHTKCCTATTHEVTKGKRDRFNLEFADYDTLEESCRDYAWLISNGAPYRKAWQQYLVDKKASHLLTAIAGVYATDTLYAKLLQQIAGQGNVVQAIAKARM